MLKMKSFDLEHIFFNQAKFIYMTVMYANHVGNGSDQRAHYFRRVYSGQCRRQLRQAQRDRNRQLLREPNCNNKRTTHNILQRLSV